MPKFLKACSIEDVKNGKAKCLTINGVSLAIFNVDGEIYCLSNECSHAGGPLCEGKLDRYELECPWHSSKFDIRTGEVLGPPAIEAVKRYEIKIQGNEIFVSV